MDLTNGWSVAFLAYGLSAIIAMGTAALIALAVKIIQANDRRKEKKAAEKK